MSDEYRFYSWSRAVEVAAKHAHILGKARIVRDYANRWVLTFDGKVTQ